VGWSCPVHQGEAVKISLVSVSSGIQATWPNREKRRAWTIAERCGCLDVRFTLSFQTEQLSKTSLIESINLVYISLGKCPALRAAQKMGDVSVIQRCEILDFQISLSS